MDMDKFLGGLSEQDRQKITDRQNELLNIENLRKECLKQAVREFRRSLKVDRNVNEGEAAYQEHLNVN